MRERKWNFSLLKQLLRGRIPGDIFFHHGYDIFIGVSNIKIFEFDYDIKWISLNVNYASNSPAISPLRERIWNFSFLKQLLRGRIPGDIFFHHGYDIFIGVSNIKIFEFDYDIKWISLNVNYASNSPAGNLGFSGRLQAFRNRSREMRNKT